MNEQELQFAVIGYIMATKKLPKSEQEINAIAWQIMQLKQQNPQQYNQLVQLGQLAQLLMSLLGIKAKLGAKLAYINKLKGICPEGTEKVYMAKGGCMCKKKVKSAAGGTAVPQKRTKMPTKYDEQTHKRLADGEAMGINNKAQQDSLLHYRKLYNKKSDLEKYNMGDQEAGLRLKSKKSCGGLVKRKN